MIERIQLYQIVVVVISSIMLFQGIKEFAKRESGQTVLKLLVRVVVWGGMAVIAVYPNVSYEFSKIVGIEDNITAVIVTGFVFVFLLIFKLLSAIEKLEQNVSELTRRDSLREAHDRIEQMRQEMVEEGKKNRADSDR